MSKPKRTCVIHPDREAVVDATGILVCDDCFDRYRAERSESEGQFSRRLFFQQLIAKQHGDHDE